MLSIKRVIAATRMNGLIAQLEQRHDRVWIDLRAAVFQRVDLQRV